MIFVKKRWTRKNNHVTCVPYSTSKGENMNSDIVKELKLEMTNDAEIILRMIKINPEVSSEELVSNGFGKTVPEVEFIREQLSLHGYI